MTPVECLQKQLDTWESALLHSHKSFQQGTITNVQHDVHINNLAPKIVGYKLAIAILQKNGIK